MTMTTMEDTNTAIFVIIGAIGLIFGILPLAIDAWNRWADPDR